MQGQPPQGPTEGGAGPFRLAELLDHVIGPAPFGFALYDQELRYVAINRTMAAFNARPAQDHLGLTIREVAPDLAEQVVRALRQVLDTGEPLIDVELVGETPGQPGKRGIWLNSFYRVEEPSAGVYGVAAMARDVTEERRLAEQVAAEQFRAAFDAALEPALMVAAGSGPDGAVELWVDYLNPAATERLGVTLAHAIGHRLADVFPTGRELDLDAHCRRVLETGSPFTGRGLVFAPEGSEARDHGHVDVSISRTPGGVLVVWRDVELEQRLLEHQVALVAERSRVSQLQRSFLPRYLPQLAGTSLAARYRSAERDAPLGGDWYDALALDGQLVLCIGDVAGHGMSAVETMGVARITARAYILEDARPEQVLSRLDRYAYRLSAGREVRPIVTMVAATYDPTTRRLRWCNAGHPPPLVVDANGPRFLHSTPHPPLGLGLGGHHASEVTLEPGGTVLLYTDGLVERRSESIDRGLERLAAAAVDLPADPAAACEALLARCIGSGHDDDVCLLVVQTEGGPALTA